MGEGLGTRSNSALLPRIDFPNRGRSRSSFPHPLLDTNLFTNAEAFVVWLVSPLHDHLDQKDAYPYQEPVWKDALDCLAHLRLFPRIGYLWKSELPGPAVFQEICASEQCAFLARNIFLASEEEKVLGALADAQVDAMVMKGTSLARILHQTIASRAASDIDLAIQPNDVYRAVWVLQELGYTAHVPLELLRRRDFLLGTSVTSSEVVCSRKAACGLSQIEIHWKLFPNDRGKPWPRHVYAGLSSRTLPPTEYFFYLTSRFAAHGWVGLQQLCDIGDFLVKFESEINWGKLVDLSRKTGVARSVQISLELAHACWGITPCRAIDPRSRFSAQEFFRRPFFRKLNISPKAFHKEQASILDHWQARVRYAGQLLRPTPEDWVHREELRSRAGAWMARATRLAGMAMAANQIGRAQ